MRASEEVWELLYVPKRELNCCVASDLQPKWGGGGGGGDNLGLQAQKVLVHMLTKQLVIIPEN